MHPVLLLEDVEITAGSQTSQKTIDLAKSMLLQMEKKPFYKNPGVRFLSFWAAYLNRAELCLFPRPPAVCCFWMGGGRWAMDSSVGDSRR